MESRARYCYESQVVDYTIILKSCSHSLRPEQCWSWKYQAREQKILTRRCEPHGDISCLFLNSGLKAMHLLQAFRNWEIPLDIPGTITLLPPPYSIIHHVISGLLSVFVSPGAIYAVSTHAGSSEESRANKGREDGSREQKWPVQKESQTETYGAHHGRNKTPQAM